MVTRPDEENFVAVIGERGIGPALLNPSEFFVYGPIPAVTEITPKQADKLWGNGKQKNSQEHIERTYRLISKDKDDKGSRS